MKKLKNQIIASLQNIPELEKVVLSGKHEGFTYFSFNGKEIAHFDNDLELDIKLTKEVIKREGLTHPSDSKSHPNRAKTKPHWIVIQLDKFSCKEVTRLIELAIDQKRK